MVSLLVVLVALCCSSLHCKAYLSLESATANDEDGNIEVKFSLNDNLNGTDNITIFVECHGVEPIQSSFTAMCNSGCFNNTSGSVIVEGPINAGETYTCTVVGSDNKTINLMEVETNNFTSETGIPSSPNVECIIKTEDSLGLKITLEHHGVPQGDPSLKINITVDDVTYSYNYSSNITFLPNMNMTDEVTVWIINKYGQSQMVSEECDELPPTSTTDTSTVVSTSTSVTSSPTESTSASTVNPTSTSATSSPAESSVIGPIVGGVVGAVVVVVLIVVLVVTITVVGIKKKKKGVLKIVPH